MHENWVCRLTRDSMFGFPSYFSDITQLKTTLRLPENAYLATLKLGVTHTYTNKKEEQPGGSPERILKE